MWCPAPTWWPDQPTRALPRVCAPLEVEEVEGPAGPIRVTTLAETNRVKGWLVLRRNATRPDGEEVALAMERLPTGGQPPGPDRGDRSG